MMREFINWLLQSFIAKRIGSVDSAAALTPELAVNPTMPTATAIISFRKKVVPMVNSP
jgi:hypothetical protein